MYLSSLELVGFKSFAKKTRLAFEPGITCIVGPNGSGKSAVADSVRWVLGEQSLKSIRAKRGEDVIFAGSRSRPRLGLADVSLTLADAEAAGLDTPELVITRRIDRTGEGEYLVNSRPVRLLDLADLLAGAGFAQKSYTVIPQGMIDSFVTASPLERRQMFEDATGVTPLLLKQQQTERKLEATRHQMERARDLLRELEPRLRSLKRAASRARSRAEIESALRAREEQVTSLRWTLLTESLASLQGTLEATTGRIRAAQAALDALRGSTARELTTATKLPELRSRLEKLRAEERDLLVALTRAEASGTADVDRVREEIVARTKEREKLTHELSEVRTRLASARAEQERLASELTELASRLGNGDPRADERRALGERITALTERARRLAGQLRTGRAEALPVLAAEAEALAEALGALATVAGATDDTSTLVGKLREVVARREQADGELPTLHAREAQLAERIRAVEERLASLKRSAAPTGGSEARAAAGARERLVAVQREMTSLQPQVAAAEATLVAAHSERVKYQAEERALLDTLHAAEQERSTVAVEEAGVRARRDDLAREAHERLGAEFLDKLKQGTIAVDKGQNPDALRAEVERLRKRLLEIGGIDESVLVEEAETEKRVTELRSQVADLDAARKNLRGAMRELERHIHGRFQTGFRAMDEKFNFYFREVFGGGRASLSLVKPRPIEHAFPDLAASEQPQGSDTDVTPGVAGTGALHVHELPAGVEIHVHPPGKKIQSLSQLSGGEKALTSIALLFAILSERSSPFVVLDEVDAALDEANSRRFARLLQDAAKATQFIVITHNRATMEVARALYGVTMGDDGVSQLLSIKLEEVPVGMAAGGQQGS